MKPVEIFGVQSKRAIQHDFDLSSKHPVEQTDWRSTVKAEDVRCRLIDNSYLIEIV